MRIGVITFPGTLDDVDAARAVRYAGAEPVALWHADHDLKDVEAVIVPGGFSYGDYLRAGAIASIAPIMTEVVAAARQGMPVLGICNGFQILCEAGLLPGALVRNAGLKFVCQQTWLRVEETDTPFTSQLKKGQLLRIPVKHGEGRYHADETTLERLHRQRQILLRYVNAKGKISPAANPNGSIDDIAG